VELRDLIVTPFLIVLVYVGAYLVYLRVTDDWTRRYFFPALTAKIVGALALGFVYQFYYNGGDTYNFHTHGSRHIWRAFMDNPETGFKLLFSNGKMHSDVYEYASRIAFFRDAQSYVVIRIAAVFDLITFSSYSATAVLFSVVSFIGLWMLFRSFYELAPEQHKWIALATLFIPSVVFWGSGLLKDTITLAGLGVATFCVKRIFLDRQFSISRLITLIISFYFIFLIKKYILLCYLPAVMVWVYAVNLTYIRSAMLKMLMFPVITMLVAILGYYAVAQVGKDDPRYALEKLGSTAKLTAYDIAYQTGRDAGSTYSLGELDGSFGGMMKLAPQAVNVSLFRPYLWEVRNPLMLMSALESTALLVLTLYVLVARRRMITRSLANPHVIFCLVFSITFAFAVGVSSFNFGTLSRYKIPLMPFYTLMLIQLYFVNRPSTVDALERTE
jgi:hypothetical protein